MAVYELTLPLDDATVENLKVVQNRHDTQVKMTF